ncbi:MAG: nucleotidyltransferase substrate binding protein [Candidatus Moeniiplasma glomeromycotorum]|nr:nucleotidyltransferase substrate binding protein [Candidatus Moeniiplasma glomeromycotorum]MCE8167523.1 nucleotidyltransferase substrate binding protein [Candidatus Moeniiplasma glomeromycotorum]
MVVKSKSSRYKSVLKGEAKFKLDKRIKKVFTDLSKRQKHNPHYHFGDIICGPEEMKKTKKNLKKQFILGEIDIQPLLSARDFLKKALKEAETELEIAGAVKAFEVCHELAWKTCQKVLKLRYIDAFSPKETFRLAGLEGLIPDAEVWYEYSEKRNITVHTYSEDILETIYPALPQFLKDFELLIKNLKKL